MKTLRNIINRIENIDDEMNWRMQAANGDILCVTEEISWTQANNKETKLSTTDLCTCQCYCIEERIGYWQQESNRTQMPKKNDGSETRGLE